MKTSLYGTLLLVAVFLAAGFFITHSINEKKETIAIEDTTLYGDIAAADGLSVSYHASCASLLHWDTVYPIGTKNSTHSTFSYEKKAETTVSDEQTDIGLHLNFGMSTSGSFDLTSSDAASSYPVLPFLDVAKRAASGSTYSEDVLLNDYYEYIPFSISCFGTLNSTLLFADIPDENGESLFSRFFRLPFTKDQMVHIEITKDESGDINALSMNADDTATNNDIIFSSAFTDSNSFLAFPSILSDKSLQDTTKMGGAYGIYTFLYTSADGIRSYDIPDDFDLAGLQIVTFCTFDPAKTSITSLALNEDKSVLFALAEESNSYVVYCIDTKTGLVLNKIDLGLEHLEDISLSQFMITDNAVMLSMTDDTLLVLSDEASSHYQLVMTADLRAIKTTAADYLDSNENTTAFDFLRHVISPAYTVSPKDIISAMNTYQIIPSYHDHKLAIYVYAYGYLTSFCHYLAVFDDNALTYLGFYDYKGDHQVNANYTAMVRPVSTDPVALTWQD